MSGEYGVGASGSSPPAGEQRPNFRLMFPNNAPLNAPKSPASRLVYSSQWTESKKRAIRDRRNANTQATRGTVRARSSLCSKCGLVTRARNADGRCVKCAGDSSNQEVP